MRLRELRKKRGLTQEELANKLGVQPSAISKLETDSNGITWQRAIQLSKILECKALDLLPESLREGYEAKIDKELMQKIYLRLLEKGVSKENVISLTTDLYQAIISSPPNMREKEKLTALVDILTSVLPH